MDLTKEFENRNSFLHWFIIASLTGVDITENIKSDPMDITMQINGEEVNVLNSIKRLEEQFNTLVNDKALELIEGARDELINKLTINTNDVLSNLGITL
jgi:hypothetical protein